MRYLIQSPRDTFGGEVAGVRFHRGAATIDSVTDAAAYAYFQRAAYTVSPVEDAEQQSPPPEAEGDPAVPDPVGLFDPGEHTVEEVLAHLATADEDEQARVRAAEADGKARTTIVGKSTEQQGAQQ